MEDSYRRFRLVEAIRRFRSLRWSLLAVTGLSVVGAMLNAAALVSVVALADLVSRHQQELTRTVGPIEVTLGSIPLALAGVLLIALSTLITAVTAVIRARMAAGWSRQMRRAVVDGFLDATWEWQSRDRAGSLQTSLGFVGSGSAVLNNLVSAAQGMSGVVIMIGTALVISPLAALGVIALGVLLFAGLRPLTFRAGHLTWVSTMLGRDNAQEVGEISELAQDIQVIGVSEPFRERAAATIDGLVDAERRASALATVVAPIYQGLAIAIVVLALGVAATQESTDIAVLSAVALLVLRSVSYGQQFQSSYTAIGVGTPGLQALDQTLADFERHRATDGTVPADPAHEIAFEEVSFDYGDEGPALDHVSARLHFGEIVGIVGPSGAGKTTLAQLLLRLRQPTSGRIRYNGVPMQDLDAGSFRRQVALVPQAPRLVHATVHDNIAFFRPGIDREAVVEAATSAGIHETIERLEHGYDTPIGRSQRDLSGGQIQRIGIARALAGKPSMLVLDEPTSALDQDSEQVVQDALSRIKGRALVVLIAHRLTTLSVCDRVIVMESGRIQAQGEMHDARATSPFLDAALRKLVMTANLDAGGHLAPPPQGGDSARPA